MPDAQTQCRPMGSVWAASFIFRVSRPNRKPYREKTYLWYSTGDAAYVEPVATVPEHRRQGLAKAVIYEACARAKALGAKRAIVVSEQEFYFRIGFTLSSEVYAWTRKKLNRFTVEKLEVREKTE